jgi:predicted dehydrogenase
MRQLGVAVVGCGVWGINHARVYAGLDKAGLVKITDTDPGRRRLAEKSFDAQCCAEPGEVFRDEEVDAVSICSPTVTHARLAREAIQAGKHVLVEKPMVTRLPDAEQLSRSVLSLPMHPFLGEREVMAVAEALGKAVSHFLR